MASIYSKAWVVDGFIGVGKSTAMRNVHRILRQHYPGLKTHFYFENVEEWQSYRGENLLQNMYESEDEAWKVRFQTKAIVDVLKQDSAIRSELGEVLAVQERDLLSIQKVFLPPLEMEVNNVDFHVMKELVEHGLKEDQSLHEKGRIFLYCEEEECYERMKTRGRQSEGQITREKFAELYEDMRKLQQNSDFVIDCTHLVEEEVTDLVAAYILEVSI